MSAGSAIAAFVAGAVVSLATSWLLVSRLERVGERLGFSEALLGIVAAGRITLHRKVVVLGGVGRGSPSPRSSSAVSCSRP